MADRAVRIYATDHPALLATMRARLEKRRAELLENLLSCLTWEGCVECQGRIHEIENILIMTAEAERELNERR